jgi:hypothetical protein
MTRGHVLLAWLLWMGFSGIGGTTLDSQPVIMEAFETKYTCETQAIRLRRTRNVTLHNNEPYVPVWVCLPVGVSPDRASFE